MKPLRILVIEDNAADAGLVHIAFSQSGQPPSRIHVVGSLREGLQKMAAIDMDAVVLDLSLPDAAGTEALEILRLQAPRLPVVVLTGCQDEDVGLDAIRKGAQNFLVKGSVSRQALAFALRQAIQQKAAELALQESVGHIQALLDNVEEMFFSIDVAGQRPPLVAKAAERIFGRPLHQFLANPWLWRTMVVEDDRETLDAMMAQLEAGHPGHAELRVALPDGRVRWVECSIQPSPGGRGMPQRIEGVLRDVTLRRTAADQAHRLEAFQDQERFRNAFLNAAAHELATPLTPIRLQLSNLLRGSPDAMPQAQRDAILLLNRNVERLGRLVADLLDASRLQSGRLRLEPKRVDMAALVLDAADSFAPVAEGAGLTLSAESERGLDVTGDEVRLHQVLTNLLHNAVKFTHAGGHVRLAASAQGGDCVVTVQDDGLGFTAEQRAELFKPFSQVHDEAANPNGTGLGLYICKGIVEQHEGSLECASAGPGQGAAFMLRVPLALEAPAVVDASLPPLRHP